MLSYDQAELASLVAAVRELKTLVEAMKEKRKPVFDFVEISSSKPYVVDYHNRKHIFLWLPSSSLTLSFEDYGSGVVQAQVWTNIGMPPSTRVTAPNNSSNTPILLCCTDEVIP